MKVSITTTNWQTILDTDSFVVEYDKTTNKYRVSYFEDNHFVDDVIFDEYICIDGGNE